ncbi:hypothetical protein B0H14DRAFT_3140118 [Mycena olivaceomarginata]|nr:hypothetical protein B0H14DRAFT_3140118 [Mycena olivaceomarginata]
MPSWSFSSALLALCSPDYENIWAWPTWCTVTGCDMPLFHPDFPPSGELPPSTLEAVRKYANKFWDKKKEVERLAYAQASCDTDTLGRSLWSRWATALAKRAAINGRIDKVLEAHYRLPHQVMDETRKLPDLGAAQTQIAYPEIGSRYSTFTFEPFVHSFVHMLVVMTWDRFRKSVGRETSKLDQMRIEVNDAFTAISVAGATPTPFHIRVFIRKAEAFIELLRRYQDNAAATEVNQRIEKMLDMFGVVGSGDKARASKLPNALRQALEHFATANIVQSLADHLNMIISGATLDMDMDMPDIPNEFVPSPAWEEGTEEYSHLSVDQLWVLLGLPEQAIPFFNTKLDPTGLHNPWTDEGNAFFEDDRNSKINLTPRWHQLVGLYKMMNMAFIAEPVVLMDEVGFGKTLQTIALVACLAYYRDYYHQKKYFPGAFKHRMWQGKNGNIPTLDSIIVVPVNRRHKWNPKFGDICIQALSILYLTLAHTNPGKPSGRTWSRNQCNPQADNCSWPRVRLPLEKTFWGCAILHQARDEHSIGGKIRNLPPKTAISHELLAHSIIYARSAARTQIIEKIADAAAIEGPGGEASQALTISGTGHSTDDSMPPFPALGELIQITRDLVEMYVEGEVWIVFAMARRAGTRVKIDASIKVGMKRNDFIFPSGGYWRGLAWSTNFSLPKLGKCLDKIHQEITDSWNFHDPHDLLIVPDFSEKIKILAQLVSIPTQTNPLQATIWKTFRRWSAWDWERLSPPPPVQRLQASGCRPGSYDGLQAYTMRRSPETLRSEPTGGNALRTVEL